MPPGWHDDPADPTSLRYWDGTGWTDQRAPKAVATQPGAAAKPLWKRWWAITTAFVVVVFLLLAAVGLATDSTETAEEDSATGAPVATPVDETPNADVDTDQVVPDEPAPEDAEPIVDDEPLPDDEVGGVDEVDCSEEALTGGDEGYAFTSAHIVVNGELGAVCFGIEDPVILDAWASLAAITPPGQLGDLTLFAGFEPDGDLEADTLAFVNALDVDGTQFQMSVNTVEAEANPDELLLTLAHEFSHVFTAAPTQLDRTDEAFDSCDTYFNGEGCYLPDALIAGWIDVFWPASVLSTIDPTEDSADGAAQRCADDDGFFGPYAGTNPEEDFAEAFSAYVFRLEPQTDGQAFRLLWIDEQPGLSEFRDRADSAGLTPLANTFELCGI